ncbi:hypothetical protein AAJ72_01060 [Citromicrobium sp. RCC1885]|nr:hypothetical protein AAJ72_01060 [Citromicrobium sp. RCC1885]KPM27637.1 hypothetical protein AAJ74_01805 [Citromicrobium sp. RCC1878]
MFLRSVEADHPAGVIFGQPVCDHSKVFAHTLISLIEHIDRPHIVSRRDFLVGLLEPGLWHPLVARPR